MKTQQKNIKEGNFYFPKYSVDLELIWKITLYVISQG